MSRGLEHVQNIGRAHSLLAAEPAGWMETLGARISQAEPGRVVLELVAGPQHRHGGGVVQGGVITQIADAAMGMSLATLQENGMWNTTIELKINFLRPAIEGRLRAAGRVIEMRQSLLFSEAGVVAEQGRLVARASSTLKPGVARAMSFDLKLSFISAAKVGEKLQAAGRVVHAGRRTAVTECRVEGPGGRLVATASATFAITREKE